MGGTGLFSFASRMLPPVPGTITTGASPPPELDRTMAISAKSGRVRPHPTTMIRKDQYSSRDSPRRKAWYE